MSEMVPQGWEVRKLGDISQIIMGQSPPSSTYNFERNGLPFFQGKTDFGNKTPAVRVWCSEPLRTAPQNSILFSVRAPVGDINLTLSECCIGRGLSAIKGKSINQNYLYLYLYSRKLNFEKLAQGSTFEAINKDELSSFEILVPPLAEQQKIASILTSVDQVIEKTESEISKLQDLKKGMMQQLLTQGIGHTQFKDSPVGRIPVGWEVVTVSDIFEFKNGKAFYADGYSEDGFIVVDLLNISLDGKFRLTPKDKKISLELYEKFPKSHLNKSDIIIIMTDINPDLELIGKTAIIDNNNFYVLNQRVGCLRILNSLDHSVQFHNYLLNSNRIRQQVKTNTLGTAQFYINTPVIKGLQLPIPPLNEQQKIIDILTSIDDSIQQQQRELQQTQNLKKSLMQDLLTGKVRVKVDSDE